MTVACTTCGNEFSISPSRIGVRKTCSRQCSTSTFGNRPAWNKGLAGDPRVLAIGAKGGLTKKGRPLRHGGQFKAGVAPWNKGQHVENAGTFKAGHTVNLGRQFPAEFGEKVRERLRGRAFQVGESHWNWKGGITEANRSERLRFRHEMQQAVFARDSYKCVVCRASGDLQVDHIKSWAEYPELRFDLDNCRTLCMACHYQVTYGRTMPAGTAWGHNFALAGKG